MKALTTLCWLLLALLPFSARAQCFATVQFPANTTVPDATGLPTTISTVSFVGQYALVSLEAGRTYRFTSSASPDHITISSAAASGALAFGQQPLEFTATTTQVHFIHFHKDNSCNTQNVARTTRVTLVYCPAGSTTCGGAGGSIGSVLFGSINNSSGGCGGGGYTNFTAGPTTNLITGQAVPITVVNAAPHSGDQVRVFVDWNHNVTLGDASEEYVLNSTDNITFTGSITPPSGTTAGPVRLRVRLTNTGAVPTCGTTTTGEVEDYTVYVAGNANALYTGGNGRGDEASLITPAPIASNIFNGGDGRGDVASLITPAPIASNIFGGGNGRGDVASLITPAIIPSNIFAGGNGRGDVASLITPAPIASNIFGGGNGRGDVASLITPAIIPSNIFAGGNGRGDVASLITPALIPSNIFAGGNGRGDVASLIGNHQPPLLLLALRGMLEGPYNPATGQMGDALRSAGIVPVSEPYTALGYAQVGGGGAESIAPAVLATTGNNAIVDWVVVELRDATTPTTILATRSALIQRDGDVVSTDGVSPLAFNQGPGSYNVALRHRNHLGVMTGNAAAFGLSTTPLDLSLASTGTFGTAARKSVAGAFPAEVLWAGDVTFNGQVKYTGSGNDRDPIFTTVGSTTPNNTILNTYSTRDVNLNGQVKYTGTGNDRDPILVNVGSTTPNNVRLQQLP